MKITGPVIKLKPQNQVNLPITSDTTLVDDPVALVDSPSALVGGQAVLNSSVSIRTKPVTPVNNLRITR